MVVRHRKRSHACKKILDDDSNPFNADNFLKDHKKGFLKMYNNNNLTFSSDEDYEDSNDMTIRTVPDALNKEWMYIPMCFRLCRVQNGKDHT
eukprot:UN21144